MSDSSYRWFIKILKKRESMFGFFPELSVLDLTMKIRMRIKKASSPKTRKMFLITDGHWLQTPDDRLFE